MKTIQERAADYAGKAWSNIEDFNEDHVTFENIATDAFVAGAQSERKELLRWRDPRAAKLPAIEEQTRQEKPQMKCHYIYTEDGEKVLIPYCWPVVLSGDMSQCTCRTEKTFAAFERERYNETVKALRSEIKDLEHENAYLNRIIKKLTKQKR